MLNLSSIVEGGKWEGGGKNRGPYPSQTKSKIIYSCNEAIYKNNKTKNLPKQNSKLLAFLQQFTNTYLIFTNATIENTSLAVCIYLETSLYSKNP